MADSIHCVSILDLSRVPPKTEGVATAMCVLCSFSGSPDRIREHMESTEHLADDKASDRNGGEAGNSAELSKEKTNGTPLVENSAESCKEKTVGTQLMEKETAGDSDL